ncbi:hypothetical protein AA0111_g10885 [Alternaria arborescens]|uniref:hypothetical protein n=1 Tax=Alternaria arborescens TaxID=156630 RepID=UPI001074F32F|nr:hypothetical protein AA0111_g10885 [Alternaria arborescens]RYO18122.1 hypothetical protein AA0111_g10885 [Alternaria arborescens]
MKRRGFQCKRTLIKIASKLVSLNISTPEPIPSRPLSLHDKHPSRDSTYDQSPWINRRILDGLTEQELHLACRNILLDSKPSHQGLRSKSSELDFGGLGRQKKSTVQAPEISVHMPISALAELSSSSLIGGRGPNIKTRTRPKANMKARARSYGGAPACADSNGKRPAFRRIDERGAQKQGKLRTHDKVPSYVPRWTNDCGQDVTLPVVVNSSLTNAIMSS